MRRIEGTLAVSGDNMFNALAPADLALIREVAAARAALIVARVPAFESASQASALSDMTAELSHRISALSLDALAELQALVWLGRGHDASGWTTLVADARDQCDALTAPYLAGQDGLETYIDRGLVTLAETHT